MSDSATKNKGPLKDIGIEIGGALGSRYRLDEKIASTRMSVVYAGTRAKLGLPVAIKFLHPSLMKNREFRTRFELETKAMSQLSHPNCVSVIDFGVTNPPFLVMELIRGQTLAKLMKNGPLETTRALLIVRQILSGLSHAHKRGILHRDIKPKNIMITKIDCSGDYVRILDFGLAKYFRDEEDNLTGKGRVAGTFEYFAPENIGHDGLERNLDQRTDLFSIGVLTYELLTGRKPYIAKSPSEIFQMHDTPPELISQVYPAGNFSPELDAIIAKSITKDPEERYQDAEEFVAAIDSVLEMSRAWKQFVIPPSVVEKKEEKTEPAFSVLGEVMVRDLRQIKWRHWALILAIIALDFGGWIAVGHHGQSSKPKGPAGQVTLAAVSLESPVYVLPRRVRGGALSPAETPHAALEALVKGKTEKPSSKNRAGTEKKSTKTEGKCGRRKVAVVHRLIRRGRTRAAIKRLEKMSAKCPSNGYYQFLLGNLYSKKRQRSEAVAAYGRAIDLRKRYRRNRRLIENTVRALSSRKAYRQATALIETKIGRSARRYLRKARRNAYGKMARIRSTEILKRWNKKRARKRQRHLQTDESETMMS